MGEVMPPRREMDRKPCALCHGLMERKRHPCGTLEKPADYMARTFCSRRCHTEHRKREARKEQRQWRKLQMRYVEA